MARIPLSKAKKILYKTRGVKSRLFPLGQTKELKWDEHLAARSLPKTHSGKKKAYQKSYGSLYRTKHKELCLLKNFKLTGDNKSFFKQSKKQKGII